MQRAVVLVINDTAEGFDRGHQAEKSPFHRIVKVAAVEVKSMIYLIAGQKLPVGFKSNRIHQLAYEVLVIIQGLSQSTE